MVGRAVPWSSSWVAARPTVGAVVLNGVVLGGVVALAPSVPGPRRPPASRAPAAPRRRRRDGWDTVDGTGGHRLPAMPRPVVLDVDTGVDDACALLLAARHPELDLLAVTCVGGNAPLDTSSPTRSPCWRRPVVTTSRWRPGRARPLLEAARDARHVHGEDGLGDLDWPTSTRSPIPGTRSSCCATSPEAPRTSRSPWSPLAPLTNIALLLRTYPGVAAGLRGIVSWAGRRSRQRHGVGRVQRLPRPGGRGDRARRGRRAASGT